MNDIKPVHSPIGASSYYRWSKCPGSVRLSKGIPSVSSAYAMEGTLAHEVAATYLDDGRWVKDVTPEMKDYVSVYTACVEEDWKKAFKVPEARLFVEQGFDLSRLHPNLYGTADAVIYDALKKTLRVYDLKYGAGITVEVENNGQLQYYGLGALLHLTNTEKIDVEHVELIIVQPRAPHDDGQIRRWLFDVTNLLDFQADLIDAAKRTEDPKAPLYSGEHCRFCPAAALCPELAQKAQLDAKDAFEVIEVTDKAIIPVYDAEKLSQTLEKIPQIEAYIAAVHAFAYSEADSGRVPPRFKLVEKRATRKWIDEKEAEKALTNVSQIPVDKLYDVSLKSPTQIEKLLPKEIKNILDPLIIKKSTGTTLVPDTDARLAIQPKLPAKEAFELEEIFS